MNKKLPWKDLKRILTEKYEPKELMLGSNKLENSNFDNLHSTWNGNKKELTDYIKEVRKHGAIEVFIYHKTDHDYFYTIWNDLEGYLF